MAVKKVGPVILEVTDQVPAALWQKTSAGEVNAIAISTCEIYHICISLILKYTNQMQVASKDS